MTVRFPSEREQKSTPVEGTVHDLDAARRRVAVSSRRDHSQRLAPVTALSQTAGSQQRRTGAEPSSDHDQLSDRAHEVATRYLTRKGHSRWELEQWLSRNEIPDEIICEELERRESCGEINDASVAAMLVDSLSRRKGQGRQAVEYELRRRHFDPHAIETVLSALNDDDEYEKAAELARTRAHQLSCYDEDTVRRRLNGFLARRGYSEPVIRHAVGEALASRGTSGVRFV